ncbi:MAG: hypothetical protein R3324_18060, partial [Halobacteriales archaeon]|nr:hypothetical protein [Halobacteriales archaeon]
MIRKTGAAAVAVVGLLVAQPLFAQEHQWNGDRPDAHAPSGVLRAVTLPAGDFAFNYRYARDDFQGLRLGSQVITFDDAFDFDFSVVPADLSVETHEAEIRYGISDALTVSASVPFTFREMTNLTSEGTEFFITESNDLGDVQLHLMYDLFEVNGYRAHISVGGSAPTGEIADRGLTPESFPQLTQLPFTMQSGSGTWDLSPGLSFHSQNEFGTVGMMGHAVIRFGENDRNYTLGDRFEGTVWASYMLNDWISASARVDFATWGDIEGVDPATDGNEDVSANPFATGGRRTTLPLGMNVLLREGPFAGLRMSVEWEYVISEDLNGPQLSQ